MNKNEIISNKKGFLTKFASHFNVLFGVSCLFFETFKQIKICVG